jgi:hypothetical protein
MDLGSVEGILLNALGGADRMTVNDLTGTGLSKVQLNLGGSAGGGDGEADNVVVNGTNGDDDIRLSAVGNTILVDGLFPVVRITGADATLDRLTVNTLGGNDAVDTSALPTDRIGLTIISGAPTPAPRVASVVVNGGAAQRSLVTQIRVAFDQHVTLPANPADAFRLVRQSDGAAVALAAAVDDSGAGTVVTLTFTGGAVDPTLASTKSLADGRYTLTVLSGQVGSRTGALDGDGDGTSGGDFVLTGNPAVNGLFRLFGDSTGDGVVNAVDLQALRAAFGAAVPPGGSPFDSNGDGVIDVTDVIRFRVNFGGAA